LVDRPVEGGQAAEGQLVADEVVLGVEQGGRVIAALAIHDRHAPVGRRLGLGRQHLAGEVLELEHIGLGHVEQLIDYVLDPQVLVDVLERVLQH
jgi:hypothetical protein